MERFKSIKNIGSRRKLDVTTICRCCGLENEDKFEIFGKNPFSDGEEIGSVEFVEKVEKITGIVVLRDDKMPQSMCIMCIEKITDSYEFRLMAENTENQTRDALGLPRFISKLLPVPAQVPQHPIAQTKYLEVRLDDIKYSIEDKALIERALARHNIIKPNIPSTSKKRVETSVAALQPPMKKSKKGISCCICRDTHFSYINDLNGHLIKDHIPLIAKYACGSCRETFEQLSDHKAHEAIHSQKKLPYTCYICSTPFAKPNQFNKHMTSCPIKEKLPVTVEDIKCFQCKKKFITQNLFEWHPCFLRTRGSCSKCGQHFQKKKTLFKHYILCEGLFVPPEGAVDPNKNVKSEHSSAMIPVRVLTSGDTTSKGPKKKNVPQRINSHSHPTMVKKELQLDISPPDEDDEYANYEEDITYDNFGNDSDSDEGANRHMEPEVEMKEGTLATDTLTTPLNIKLEKPNDTPAVRDHANSIPTAEIIRKIKNEKVVSPTVVTQQQHTLNNRWKLKIKEEHGAVQPAMRVINPLAVGAKVKSKTKIFKIPQGLALQIKLEKKDKGPVFIEERDEADPEEGENLMPDEIETPKVVRIKKEKVDPAYGEGKTGEKSGVVKQLINPLALMMRNEEPVTNGFPEKSLIISAVTSISSESTPLDDNSSKQNEIEANPSETSVVEATKDTCNRETNSLTSMVEIPAECLKSNQENHSSQLAEGSVGVLQRKNAAEEGKIGPIEPMETSDDLEALLRKYEGEPTASDVSNNDLFQDLLKFE